MNEATTIKNKPVLSRRRFVPSGALLSLELSLVTGLLAIGFFGGTAPAIGQSSFLDKSADHAALPKVPQEFQVTLFASEPLVRQPCSMAFDERGRLFAGMGPQYRNPKPETPADSVVIVQDTDGDGRADHTTEFATGWSSGYGAERKDGQLTNEGRIFRVAWKDAPQAVALRTSKSLDQFSVDELIDEFDSPLPVRRINAQDELARRGIGVQRTLAALLTARRKFDGKLTENQETWMVWAVGRMQSARELAGILASTLRADSQASLNLQVQFYERTFDAGRIELGGNTDDGRSGGKGNYIVAVTPLPLERRESKATMDAAIALLERGDRLRGELLFRHSKGAGCFKCHSLDQSKNGFGPKLSSIGLRSNPRHIVQSIVEPSAVITEGFNQLTIVTDEGKVHSGVLLEESGLTLSLGQSSGERVEIPKVSIEERQTVPKSTMPDMAEMLTPQQVADLATFLLSMQTPLSTSSTTLASRPADPSSAKDDFSVEEQKDRLRISLSGKPIVDFVFRDDKILRPYFANAKLTEGLQITRNHPPVEGKDAIDHDTMHPGIWLGFGDINGQDFWRNKSAMEHVRFVTAPTVADGKLRFATECRMKTSTGEPLCLLTNHFALTVRPSGWLLLWEAEFRADQHEIVFGDQEEMGFGARVATPFTERNGGLLRSSTGKRTAKETWGQPAAWCDYSGSGERAGGIMLMASDRNFRGCWWHNRDYGVFVANPFGREAMKQGARSSVTVAKGETLKLTFGALVHDHREIDSQVELRAFEQTQVVELRSASTAQ